MKRIIDFQVNGQIVRVEYESKYKSEEEMKSLKFPEAFNVMREAEEALKKQMGNDSYEIEYWYWIK